MRFFGTDTNAQQIGRLKNIPIFHTLTRRELLEVDELLHERAYDKGEIIFEKGQAGHGIFIILAGKVRVNPCPELPASAAMELGPGELFGELSLFDEMPRLATIVALERTLAVALFQAEFSSLLTTNKNIGVKVLVEIARTLSLRTRKLLLSQTHTPSL
jgi:CRP-like cAMP-binding protein